MTAAAFDTLSTARDLEAAGIIRAHAEAIAQAINHGDERAATKADIDSIKSGIDTKLATFEKSVDAKLATFEKSVDAKLASLEARLTNRLYAVVLAAVMANGLIAAALKLL